MKTEYLTYLKVVTEKRVTSKKHGNSTPVVVSDCMLAVEASAPTKRLAEKNQEAFEEALLTLRGIR